MSTNEMGDSFLNYSDDFDLYIDICRYAKNSKPKDIILDPLFNKYRVSKKKFPRKSFYSL